MSSKHELSLAKNIARVLSANFWVAMIGFVGSFIFPRILTIESYALYHTFTLYIGYIAILHLGFPSGMVINYAGQNYDDIDRKQYRSEVSLLLLILTGFTFIFLTLFLVSGNRMIGYITVAIIPIGLVGSYKSLFQAWSKFKLYTRLSAFIATAIPGCALLYYIINNELPGEIYIYVYLAVYWVVILILLAGIFKKIKGVKGNKLFSNENWLTEKTGFALMMGNYINVLFMSADKQFIKWFFGTVEFAYYSFGMSMQALMTVFITSIAQPLFPAMAQGRFKDEDYNSLKELMLIFGSLSGCAYFATSIIVKLFIQKYIGSLEIVGIYFVVFPVMAVINCLYINLYKIKGLMKTYITTLVGILVTAVVLNALFIWITGHFTGVAIATTLTYYIWFFIGFKQFRFLKITIRDIVYLAIYTAGFFLITRTMDDIIGFVLYFVFICILAMICYGKRLLSIIREFRVREI